MDKLGECHILFCCILDGPLACIQTPEASEQQKQEVMASQLILTIFLNHMRCCNGCDYDNATFDCFLGAQSIYKPCVEIKAVLSHHPQDPSPPPLLPPLPTSAFPTMMMMNSSSRTATSSSSATAGTGASQQGHNSMETFWL